jgi:hypothetical protein
VKFSTQVPPIAIQKYYDFGAREFLIVLVDWGRRQVAAGNAKIYVVDLVTFRAVAEFTPPGPVVKICPIKRARCLLYVTKGSRRIGALSFAKAITSVFRNERPEIGIPRVDSGPVRTAPKAQPMQRQCSYGDSVPKFRCEYHPL